MDLGIKSSTREKLLAEAGRRKRMSQIGDVTAGMTVKMVNPDDRESILDVIIKKIVKIERKVKIITNLKNWTVPEWYPCIPL